MFAPPRRLRSRHLHLVHGLLRNPTQQPRVPEHGVRVDVAVRNGNPIDAASVVDANKAWPNLRARGHHDTSRWRIGKRRGEPLARFPRRE